MKIPDLWIVPRVIYPHYTFWNLTQFLNLKRSHFKQLIRQDVPLVQKLTKHIFTGMHLSIKCHLLACYTFYKLSLHK